MSNSSSKTRPSLREVLIQRGVIAPVETSTADLLSRNGRTTQPPSKQQPAKLKTARDQANAFIYQLSESRILPSGFRARCRWLLDVQSLCLEAERFFELQWPQKTHDHINRAILAQLWNIIIASRKHWLGVALKLTYSPDPASDLQLLKSYNAMRESLEDENCFRSPRVRKYILEFLREHKRELDRQANIRTFYGEGYKNQAASNSNTTVRRRGRVRFVR
ncbi:hypothetical protein [Deinococcus aestuarii]|uniref:hypothetical protein n=1 Tax=Deinococcus aestuarii TaxID=2774531 RepID=UPI001C0CF8DD|nr:hypothetical protein [Deinococcus aestuarii]